MLDTALTDVELGDHRADCNCAECATVGRGTCGVVSRCRDPNIAGGGNCGAINVGIGGRFDVRLRMAARGTNTDRSGDAGRFIFGNVRG